MDAAEIEWAFFTTRASTLEITMKCSPYGVSGTAKSMENRMFSSAASATVVTTPINAKK